MIEHDLTPEQRAELGDLDALYSRLREYDAPEPNSQPLLATLKPLLDARRTDDALLSLENQKLSFKDWLGLVWKQAQLLETPFWLSALVLIGVGILCSIVYGSSLTAFFLLLLSPLFAVGGVAYLFRPATRTLWELEQFSRFSSVQLLYARMTLVLAVNVIAAGVLLLVASTQDIHVILWRLLALWLGPMIGLMGVALFCSIRWNTIAGIVVPVLAWAALIVIGWGDATFVETPRNLFSLDLISVLYMTSDLLLVGSLFALLAGIALFYAAGKQLEWRSSFAA